MSNTTVEPFLEIRDLSVCIQQRKSVVRAVNSIDLSIARGETLGLVGESGSGKSVTALSILRLLPPGGAIAPESRITIDGESITDLSDAGMRGIRGRLAAMVFQEPMTALNPTMTIGRQIAEVMKVHLGIGRSEARKRTIETLALVGMPRPEERLAYFPHQLSGGLRQRVVIAIALACRPKLLIADEPTTALDVTIQEQILTLLTKLKKELGLALLLITHDMGVIAGYADRVAVMYAGRIVESAPVGELFGHTRHPYTHALLASVVRAGQNTGRRLHAIPGAPPNLTRPLVGCSFRPRCPYATERCAVEQPTLTSDERDHWFACFHPLPSTSADVLSETGAVDGAAEATIGRNGPILALDHVSKTFPVTRGVLQRTIGAVQAVSDVSFAVREGESFGIVGESGCGKTTLGRLIVGLESTSSGAIQFEGRDLAPVFRRTWGGGGARRALYRDLQLMFQDPYSSLDPRMGVSSILREPLATQGIGTAREQDARIVEILEEVGLPRESADRYPHEFSGGQRQRIGLARALILEPKLLVADEPVSALDVSVQAQILNLIRKSRARRRLTLIIISHNLLVIRYMADRIGVMYLGRLVEVGPAKDVYERPLHPYTAGLINAILEPDPTLAHSKDGAAIRGAIPSALNPPSGCRFRTRCPFAQPLCAEIEPPMREIAPGHSVACHFPLWGTTQNINER